MEIPTKSSDPWGKEEAGSALVTGETGGAPPRVDTVRLRDLVGHAHAVAHDTLLETVRDEFRLRNVNYLAVLRDQSVVGLCSRHSLGNLMSSRFGFALHSKTRVEGVLEPTPLIVTEEDPVRTVLEQAFCREGEAFFEDVLLIDRRQRLVGLIETETLSKVQTRLVAEQLATLEKQRRDLERRNVELFAANHAQRQSRGLFLGLFESNALGVALLDLQGAVKAGNRRFGELFGQESAAREDWSLLELLREADRAPFLAQLARHGRPGKGVRGDAVFEVQTRAPRRPRWLRVTLGWIVETGQVCACFEDITEQRALEIVVRRQEKQNLLDSLVGGIAHELNNKLTPVTGFAELLASQTGDTWAQYIRPIRQSVSEATAIIKQLLQLSRPVRGDVHVLDLRAVGTDAAQMLTFKMREGNVSLHVRPQPAVLAVRADAGQLKQILINLLINAVQALEGREGAAIELTMGRDEDRVWLEVTDNGPGIEQGDLERIFDPFFTTKGPDKGSGLGLSISSNLARQYGGTLTVTSEPGAGATFRLVLPRAEEAPAFLVDGEGDQTGPPRIATPAGRRRTVLVVEDEEILRSLLQEILRGQLGCEVDLVSDGAAGWERLQSRDYDLIVSDVRMPRMNGLEFYERIRAERPALMARLIFVTGHGGTGEGDMAERLAATGRPILNKPFTMEALQRLCDDVLVDAEL